MTLLALKLSVRNIDHSWIEDAAVTCVLGSVVALTWLPLDASKYWNDTVGPLLLFLTLEQL